MNSSRVLLALGVLAFAQLPARADVTLAGTAWYNGNTGSISPNPSAVNHWVPSNQGNITGLVLSPGDRSQFGTNSGTVYLQNLILPNAAAGGGATAAFLTVIDLSTNLVVGSSLNAVGATQDTSLTTTAPFRFDSIALSSSGSYAFVFTTTTGVSGTAVSGLPAETGQRLAVGADIDSSAENSLVVATSRWGGVVNTGATGTDLMVNTGVYTPNAPSPAGQFTNYDQWYTATYTTTAQHLTTLDAATSATVIQPAAFTAAEGFRKTGGGTYVLNTNNTNTGDVIVEQGTLRIDLATNGTSAQRVGTGVIMLNNYGAQSQASNQ
ncbi:MAG: autotransporter-associated beta strand repeat-containing protein, partial [Verrucomicrobium sp.]